MAVMKCRTRNIINRLRNYFFGLPISPPIFIVPFYCALLVPPSHGETGNLEIYCWLQFSFFLSPSGLVHIYCFSLKSKAALCFVYAVSIALTVTAQLYNGGTQSQTKL